MVGNHTIRVKRARTEVTTDNHKILQLLDLLQTVEKISNLPQEKVISRLKTKIVNEVISRKELQKIYLCIR